MLRLTTALALALFFQGGAAADPARLVPAKGSDGKWGYRESVYGQDEAHARVAIPYRFDWAQGFGPDEKDDHAAAESNGRYGLIDRQGKWIVAPKYDWIDQFSHGVALVYLDGKIGAVDRSGKVVVPIEYDRLRAPNPSGLMAATKGRLWGIVDRGNRTVQPFEFLLASTTDDGLAAAYRKDQGWQYFDERGQRLFADRKLDSVARYGDVFHVTDDAHASMLLDRHGATVLDHVESASGGPAPHLVIVKTGGRHGLFDARARNWVLPAELRDLSMSPGGLLIAQSGRTQFQLYDGAGKALPGQSFEDVRPLDALYKVKRKARWALMDASGKYLIGFEIPVESTIRYHRLGYVAASAKGWGMVDRQGRILVPFEFGTVQFSNDASPIEDNNDRYSPVRQRGSDKVGVLAPDMTWAVPLGTVDVDEMRWQGHSSVDDKWIVTSKDKGDGLYSLAARKDILAPQAGRSNMTLEGDHARFWSGQRQAVYRYDDRTVLESSSRDYLSWNGGAQQLIAKEGGKVGLLDRAGRPVVPFMYDRIERAGHEAPANRFYFAARQGRLGMIDHGGRVLIPFEYDVPGELDGFPDMSDGLATLRRAGETMLVDAGGRVVATATGLGAGKGALLRRRTIGDFTAVVAIDKTDGGETHHIQLDGRLYAQVGGDLLRPSSPLVFQEGLMAVKRNGKFGFINPHGTEAIAPQFERVSSFQGGTAYAKKDGKWMIINRQGAPIENVDPVLATFYRQEKREQN